MLDTHHSKKQTLQRGVTFCYSFSTQQLVLPLKRQQVFICVRHRI